MAALQDEAHKYLPGDPLSQSTEMGRWSTPAK